MITAKGSNGTLSFDGNMVTIERTGLGRLLVGKGTKRIPIAAITAVQWKRAGIVAGYIQFTMAGSTEVRSRFGRQSYDAQSDENSVTFHTPQQARMERVRDAIEAAIAARHQPGAPAPQGATAAERMTQLDQLRHAGQITQEEFEQARQRILGSL
jgi:hypothetical protein